MMILSLQNIIPTHLISPWWLLLFLPFAALLVFKVFRKRNLFASIRFSDTSVLQKMASKGRAGWIPLLNILRYVAVAFLIIAMARPATIHRGETGDVEGIDIVIVNDISGSMLAQDFQPNRLEAAKEVTSRFIAERPNDRIGLVLYAGNTYTLSPLTSDKATLTNLIQQVDVGIIENQSTAIGEGIATAINRLKGSTAVSKVIILLTDGENNAGNIHPMQAAEIAGLYGIRLYTIGVGSYGMAKAPVQIINGHVFYDYVEVRIDEEMLTKAAEISGGKYFRATDKNKLAAIYQEIDKMEKSKLDIMLYQSSKELYFIFLYVAGLLLLIELLLRTMFFRMIP
jgi:Ca-activated chloride channel family protein